MECFNCMDESTRPAQCGKRVVVLAGSVEMRIVNDAGWCFACSDADKGEVKATLLAPVMMTMLTHIPWQAMVSLIIKRVGKTDSVALTSHPICDYRHIHTVTAASVCACQAHRLFFLSSTSALLTWIRLRSLEVGHRPHTLELHVHWPPSLTKWHSICMLMYKGQKQLSCNLFSVAITLHHFLHIFTLILATSTFLSAGRKSSQITALYSSVCECYWWCTDCVAASLRGVRSLPMSSRQPSCSEVGTTLLTSDCRAFAWSHH